MARLQQLLVDAAARTPETTALVCGDERTSYRDLLARARQVAWALRARGVAPGDRVMVFCENGSDAVAAFWGVLTAGAVAVPINPLTRADKLAWLLEHCRASALIAARRLAPIFVPAARRGGHLRAVLIAGGTVPDAGLSNASDFAAAMASERADVAPASEDDDASLAALIYTSGSTGRPKGVMLSHRNMRAAAASVGAYLGLRADDVIHGVMPLAFDYGLYQMVLGVQHGARLVLAPAFALPAQVLKQAAAEGVTFFPGVPTVFAMLGALPDVSRWELSRVRAVTSTAAALQPGHIATIRRVFPRARIFSMYGVTECKRCSYLPPEELDRKPDSVGLAIPGTELWLVDAQDQPVLEPGRVGQIVVRGETVMQGYWEDREATARRLRPGPRPGERVLYTGDLGRLDADGYLYFVGRMDDIIKSRGEKVAPKEVEAALCAIPGVLEAAVIGVPDPLLGHAVKAFVVAAPGATLTEASLLRGCRDRLEAFMVPQAVLLVPSLPRSANGKIDKLALGASAAGGEPG